MSARSRAVYVSFIVGALGLVGCSSDYIVGSGILVTRDGAVELCEAFDAETEACIGPIQFIGEFSLLDDRAIEMSELDTVRVSNEAVELVRVGDKAIVVLEARPID